MTNRELLEAALLSVVKDRDYIECRHVQLEIILLLSDKIRGEQAMEEFQGKTAVDPRCNAAMELYTEVD
jgi:hypothetical protein